MTRYIRSTFAPNGAPQMIEIIAVPNGEAPDWVRREWVGVRLPVLFDGPHDWAVQGVVSGPRMWLMQVLHNWLKRPVMQHGYMVSSPLAIDLLAERSPEAAAWWRDVVPHLAHANSTLIFESRVCRVVPAPPPTPAND